MLLLGAALLVGGAQTAGANTPPIKPGNVTATTGDARVTLAWTNPQDTSITGYQVRYGQGETVPDSATWKNIPGSDATTTTHEVTGLRNGYPHAFQIRAVNADGESDPSATVTKVPSIDGQPPAPTIVSVGPGTNDTDLDVVWSWSRGDSGCTVDRYLVQYKRTDVDDDWKASPLVNNDANIGIYEVEEDLDTGVTNKRFTINKDSRGLIENTGEIGVTLDFTTYDVRVLVYSFACNKHGGLDSDGKSGRPLYLLGKPTSFTATAGDTKATLAATVVQRGPAIQKWQYTYKADDDGTYIDWTDIADSASLSISGKEVTGLTNGTTYTFKVRGVNEDGAGAESDEVTVTLMAPTNTPPTAADNTVTTDEDTAYTFDAADFNFSDVDIGDTLASVKVTSLETAGALRLSGADVTENEVISATDIDADNLTFTPAANANGDPYASFRFSVNDGTDDSAASHTITIDVTAVNDAPTVANAIGVRSVAAGSNLTVALETDGSEVFNDVDGDTLTYSAASAIESAATVIVDNDANTLTLRGVAAGTSEITVTANDGNGGTVNDTFTLTVTSDSGPTNTPPRVANAIGARSVTAGSTLTVELETDGSEVFTDVDGDTLTYTASSATESAATVSVDNDANTLTLTGVAAGTSVITATAADGNGGTANDTFTVTVTTGGGTTDLAPTFGNAVVADQSYTQNTAIATLTLPRASSGDGTVTYSLSPAAPAGLTFDASVRTLTGTPMQAQPATPYTYTATDSDGDSASLTFSITVTADLTPSFDDRTIADQSYTQNTAIATLTLPGASSGDGTLTYTLSPVVPTGLTFDASTRALTGTPMQAQPATPYTYTATDSDGDSASLTFSITVTADLTPSFDDRTIADQSYTQHTAIATLTLPRASGGDGTLTYTLRPAAPAGLTFDASTRTLTGTPTQAQPATPYTYTATDSDGDSASLTFTITVEADLTPSFGTETIADQSYTQHTAIATLTLPRASGGDGTLTYTLRPAAPAGLTFDASTRTLGGTPTHAQPATPYTYTATDADGDSMSLTFAITVEALPVPASPSGLATSAGDGQVSLRWADPDNGSILRYQVRFRAGSSPGSSLGPSDDGLWQDIPGSGATTTAYTVPGLTNRTQYVFQVRAVNASGEGDASAQVTAIPEGAVSLEAERQAMSMVLSEIARATLAGAAEMVGERMRARPGTSTFTLAGRQVSGAGWSEPALDERGAGLGEPTLGEYAQRIGDSELLRGSAFTLSLSGGEAADGAPEWTMWGRGDVRSFSGRKHRSDWDGSLGSGWLGVDVRASGQVFAGLALSRSRGEVDYRVDAEDGNLETSLTAVWPYLQMTTGDGVEVQLLVGVGSGDAEHRSVEDEVSRAALSMTAVSVGARWPVWTRGSVTLRAVTDAGVARLETEGSSTLVLDGLTARSWRVRGGLEAAHSGMAVMGSQWWLAPRGTVTVRRDGGDGVTGTGVEIGGGVRFRGPASRFSLDASWHWLGLHSEEGVREWSASIEAGLAPGAGGRGLWWTLGPRWGVEREGAMRGEDIFHQRFGTETQDGVFAARAGYGVGTSGGLMTPFAEMEFGGGEDGVQRYGAGVEFELREGITATVRGEHREAAQADTRIGLGLRVQF